MYLNQNCEMNILYKLMIVIHPLIKALVLIMFLINVVSIVMFLECTSRNSHRPSHVTLYLVLVDIHIIPNCDCNTLYDSYRYMWHQAVISWIVTSIVHGFWHIIVVVRVTTNWQSSCLLVHGTIIYIILYQKQ